MLIILNDPSGITGRNEFEWDYAKTIQQNIEAHLESGGECEALFNGIKVDPCEDVRFDGLPSAFDRVVIVRRPAAAAIPYLVGAVVSMLVVAAAMPKVPDAPAVASSIRGATGKDSPNNSLTGQANVARAYQAIPDVYGYRRVWPDLIQPSAVEYISNIKYVTEWMCVSRGKGDITDTQYSETALSDIPGASFEVFEPSGPNAYPEFNTTTLNNVIETFASDDVNGQELIEPEAYSTVVSTGDFVAASGATQFTITIPNIGDLNQLKSVVPSGTATVAFSYTGGSFSQTCTVLSFLVSGGNVTFTFGSSAWASAQSHTGIVFTITPIGTAPVVFGPYTLSVDSSRLRWNTVFLRGLKGTVNITAEWWKVDSLGVEVSGTRQNQAQTFTADTYDQRFYTTEVTPSGGFGRYRIQFYRTNANNGDGSADVAKLEELYAVRHYATKSLPGVTVIRLTTRATDEAVGSRERKFNLRFSRHVRTLTSDALSASRNFARIIAHIWTIAGNPVSELDTDAMQSINTQLGETSELLRFDCSLDDADTSLGERIQTVASHARCTIWRDGTKWTVTRDQARAYPEMQLDYRNLASGGESSIAYSAHLPATYDGVEVEYADEVTQAKKSYFRLNITTGSALVGTSSNPMKVKLIGCATLNQASNKAYLEANRLLFSRITVADKSLSEGASLGLGALVRWIDPGDFSGDDGLQAGEVLSINGNVIMTSEALDWKGFNEGRILLTGADGLHLGPPVICYPSGSAAVTLQSIPSGLYVANPDRQLGSRYAFGVGLSNAELESSGLYTVTEIKPEGEGVVSLALAQYDERIYGAD
jgi:hypothetical protein